MRHATHILTAVVVVALAAGVGWARIDPTVEVKWSQPPVRLSEDPNMIYGWDEVSMVPFPIAADDFLCEDPRPVIDVHWWGSLPYRQPGVAPKQPDGFLITFWTDVPARTDPNMPWSHPKDPIWQIDCRNYQWEPVGYDIDVYTYHQTGEIVIVDEAYQYNQTLRPDEYFHQDLGTTYWLSIQAYWNDPNDPNQWGWKTRPHYWNDDAVLSWPMSAADGGADPQFWWDEIWGPDGQSWDLSFELSVPEPGTMALLATGGLALLIRRRRRG